MLDLSSRKFVPPSAIRRVRVHAITVLDLGSAWAGGDEYEADLAAYVTTKAIVSFPTDRPIPKALVKKLVKTSVKAMKRKREPS